jgi:hypothetical protein
MTMVVHYGDKLPNPELPKPQQPTLDLFAELKTPFKIKHATDASLHYVSIEYGKDQATPRNASVSDFSFLTNPVQPGYSAHRVDGLNQPVDYSLTATLRRAQKPLVVA